MNRRRILALALGLAVVALVVALGVAIAAQGQAERPRARVPPDEGGKVVGKVAPDFTITTFDGGKLTLSELRGKVVLLNFWASWCPPCRAEAPNMEGVWQDYRDQGVIFVGVDIQDTESEARDFLQQFNITYPNGPDPTGRIARDYGITNIPTSVFVSRQGVIARRWVGAIDRARLTEYLDELLAP